MRTGCSNCGHDERQKVGISHTHIDIHIERSGEIRLGLAWLGLALLSPSACPGVSKENERRPKIDAKVLAGPISAIRFNGDGSRMAYATSGEVTPFVKESAWDSTNSRASFDGHSKGIISLDYSKSRPFK